MDTKEIKINCPEGFEIDKENSTFELPKTWEEYCRTHKRQYGECWIENDSNIGSIRIGGNKYYKDAVEDKNLLPSKELAEAMLALCQLIQLRDCYNNGWTPDCDIATPKYCIHCFKNNIEKCMDYWCNHVLVFKSELIRDAFIINFKDLIETAKPLL